MANIAVYLKERQGETVVFLIAPAHYPKMWALLAIGALLVVVALSVGSLLVLLLGAACLWLGYTDHRPVEHKKTSTIRVGADAIESDIGTFKKSDIEQLTIRSGYTSSNVLETVGATIGQLLKAPVEEVTGSLVLRSKGIERMLAGGLDPATARSLLSEVTEALDASGASTTGQPSMTGPAPIAPIAQDAWDHLVLPPEIRTRLQQACAFIQDARARGTKGAPPHVLLYGAPGTGKTEVARTIARSGIPLVVATLADIRGGFIGQSAANVKRLFERARAIAPSILFIDEIDAIAFSRDSSVDGQIAAEIVPELLVHMDGVTASPVLILAAANYPERIDPAVLARFRYRIEMPLPDEHARRDILEGLLRNAPGEAVFDIDEVASAVASQTSGYSGRDLNDLVRSAVQLAVMQAPSANEMRLPLALITQEVQRRGPKIQVEL